MHILLVGHGKMAKAVKEACLSREKTKVTHYHEDFDWSNKTWGNPVAVHFGSGRQLDELIETCESLTQRIQIPIIQGSTKLTCEPRPSWGKKIAIINTPNNSIPMMRFMLAFPEFAKAIIPGMNLDIVESHPKKKADVSGTARAIVKSLSLNESVISPPIRDKGPQLSIGVPEKYIEAHAYHDFIFTGKGVQIKVSTRIHGRETYAEGVLELAQILNDQTESLKPGIYEIKDILHLLPKK